jgi:hypothetical protein
VIDMRDCLIVLAIVFCIAFIASFYDDGMTPAEMAESNPCMQAHTMPNSCLVVSLSKR